MVSSGSNLKEIIAARRKLHDWLGDHGLSGVRDMARGITKALTAGGSVFVCGNGGSASQAEHFAAELVGRFKKDRTSLRVFALSTNSSVVTSVSNDYGYANVYSHQLEGMGSKTDLLLALSTSGSSENVVRACKTAAARGMKVYALTGEEGGAVASNSDMTLKIPDTDTPRIQEIHLVILHLICEQVEEEIFSPEPASPEK